MNRKAIGIAAGVLVLGGLVFVSVRSGGRQETARVYVARAAARDVTHAVKAAGQVNARVKVNISAHVIGKIDRLWVKEGDAIEAGKPFLELEQESYVAARDDAKARFAMADTQLRQAKVALDDQQIRLERARRLVADEISPREALESAELQHTSAELSIESAQQGVQQARALLDKAADDLRKTTIYAPISGRVVALNAEVGEVVVSGTMNNPASVIGTIADLSEILVEVDVDETDVVHVREGLGATVEIDAMPDLRLVGQVVEVGSSGFAKPQQPDVQFFRVKLLLAEPDSRLRPGMSARATIEVERHEGALAIPLQAVVERAPTSDSKSGAPSASAGGAGQEVPTVFVVEAGRARQREVRTGLSDTTHVEILEGIAGDDQVVTGPYRSLKKLAEGAPVRIVDQKSDKDKKPARDLDEDEDE